MAESNIETDPGYGYVEEGMAVEEDHMGEGALRFALVGFLMLILMIFGIIEWVKYEGPIAADQNAVYEPSPLLRQTLNNASEKLSRYAIVNADSGQYQIPIDRAMTIVAGEYAKKEAAGK